MYICTCMCKKVCVCTRRKNMIQDKRLDAARQCMHLQWRAGHCGLTPTVEGWALPELHQQWRAGHCRTYTNSGGLGTAGLIPTTLQRMVISVCLRLSALLPAINNSWRQLTWPKRSVYLTSTMHIARKCPPFSSTTQWASTIIVFNNQIGNTGVCSDLLTLLHQ